MGELEVVKETKVVEIVESRVRDLVNQGELDIPPGYSPENAMKAAWLVLQETLDKNKKPVLQSCSQASIANSLFSMAVSYTHLTLPTKA